MPSIRAVTASPGRSDFTPEPLPIPFVLAQFGLPDPWADLTVAAIIAAGAVLLAAVVHLAVYPLAMHIAHRTPTQLDGALIQASRWPVNFGILLLGGYISVDVGADLAPAAQRIVDLAFQSAGVLTGMALLMRLVSRTMDWVIEQQTRRAARGVELRLLPMLRRVVVSLLYVMAALLVLGILGINVNPLIAGLGLGGVAVGLAIQPTLANLFAGTYVMTEGVVSPGDYIEMEGGVAGYVLEVGWRSTRLRTWGNNLVVVPNSRFAETILTNYYEPESPVNVYLTCGVSYDSDLANVQSVSMEVMNNLLETSPHGVKEYGAYFGFDSFDDSNVGFWLFVQAKDRLAGFELRSELIHELHRRFADEGIVINYPVREVRFSGDLAPPPMVGPGGPPRPPGAPLPADLPASDIAAPEVGGAA